MIDTPQIVQSPAILTAMVHLTIPRAQIRFEMGPGLKELREALTTQGVAPIGPWFTHHLRMEPGIFDFEIAVPVREPIKPSGRVQPGEIRACKVARTIYRGGYEGLGAAWEEFEAWVKSNGHKPQVDLWEVYAKGPETGPDTSKWETYLNRPVAD